ncbi:hypothetical protein LTR70_006902 [Exophiala xenobiotica]|uniref:Uncharacterized protein n=1 Tax=Lithohypha guttulata TaxID=1690604 RepID=A0ABR0K5L3_9EURO|nr:hypothetical protein LTR24_006553 [Lithohypha guttulata]KAK5314940.1 hypothetical protein LTR70_006902 [Exophiala xenobiotica]
MHSSFYVVDYAMVAIIPDVYKDLYDFNELEIGLAYVPRGVGIIVGGYCNGKLMDHNYRHVARQRGLTIDKAKGDDLFKFPIELARARSSWWLLFISTATLIAYGWLTNFGKSVVHVSVPLVLQFVQGFWGTCFYTTFNALLVDIYPESPSTAAAAASISSGFTSTADSINPLAGLSTSELDLAIIHPIVYIFTASVQATDMDNSF